MRLIITFYTIYVKFQKIHWELTKSNLHGIGYVRGIILS